MPAQAPPPRCWRNNHPVDIEEALESRLEPEEVRAVIVAGLIEGDDESVGARTLVREKCLADEALEACRVEQRQFGGVVVVESKECGEIGGSHG
ncbi:hypothetical protein [Jiella pelagia]|uniref:Uncharacterized protein n=1 Tax=Jiella pelagia TaxID=2986949 RepID=A0ABY7BVD3_9HYPH|nr:hypothetical protein [Jiella pelagia]WAP67769.1 hypothetical protein OH818_20195 [Jiella pelagia]